ncbi:MAG: hypothetical protein GY821_05515, partial [Gammaproteobacteria bacterium]|nr:hypothetical protein [Gammaproteobacteria bacterium]
AGVEALYYCGVGVVVGGGGAGGAGGGGGVGAVGGGVVQPKENFSKNWLLFAKNRLKIAIFDRFWRKFSIFRANLTKIKRF